MQVSEEALELIGEAKTSLRKVLLKDNEKFKLDMVFWVDDKSIENVTYNSSHWCGSSCCICGHMALDTIPPKGCSDLFIDLLVTAKEIACKFEELLGSSLGSSIYNHSPAGRRRSAKNSGLFNEEDLQHPHLNGESDFQSAIDYLELVESKLTCEH